MALSHDLQRISPTGHWPAERRGRRGGGEPASDGLTSPAASMGATARERCPRADGRRPMLEARPPVTDRGKNGA